MADTSISMFSNQYNQARLALQNEGNKNPSSSEIVSRMNEEVVFKGKPTSGQCQAKPALKYAPPTPQMVYNDQNVCLKYAPPTPPKPIHFPGGSVPVANTKYAPPTPPKPIYFPSDSVPVANTKYAPPTPPKPIYFPSDSVPVANTKYAPPTPQKTVYGVTGNTTPTKPNTAGVVSNKGNTKEVTTFWNKTKKAFVKIKDFLSKMFQIAKKKI